MLRFVHISDTHINFDLSYTKRYALFTPLAGVERLIAEINALPFTPDFVLHTGDIAYDPHPDIYPRIAELFAQVRVPVVYVAGNHDHRASVNSILNPTHPVQDYQHHTFDAGGVQIVLVDTNGPAEVPRGFVTAEVLAWLETICNSDDPRPLVIALHHNIVPMGVPWLDEYMRTTNGLAVHEVLRKAAHRLRGVFHGHIHQPYDVLREGVLYSAAMSSWCSFLAVPDAGNTEIAPDFAIRPGFSVVTVTTQQTTIRRHSFEVMVEL